MYRYTVIFRTELDRAKFARRYGKQNMRKKYNAMDVVVPAPKREIRSPFSADPFAYYKAYNLDKCYDVLVPIRLNPNEFQSCVEVKKPVPTWDPINVQQLTTTINYGTYEVIGITGFDLKVDDVTVKADGLMVGPWYLSSSYCNIYEAWDVSLGSGIVVTAQEQFDYTNINYFLTPSGATTSGWVIGGFTNEYELISGDTHPVFEDYTFSGGGSIGASGALGVCYWYSGGDYSHPTTGEGCIHAYEAADATLVPDTTGAFYSPRSCYTDNFDPVTGDCTNGEYKDTWIGSSTPSGFAPHSHGDGVVGVFGSRITPTIEITSFVNAIGSVGVAPECTILIGSNDSTYDPRESVLGADIRIGAFAGQWSQTDSDLARSYGTILVRGPGGNHNLNYTQEYGQKPPHNSVQVAPARYLGNAGTLLESSFAELHATGNLGMYCPYGRSDHVDFAAPAHGVWMPNIRYNEGYWGPWCVTRNGASYSTSFAGGALATMAALNTGWSWEDIVTAICQTARQYEFRVVPFGETSAGATMYSGGLTYTPTQTNEIIRVVGNGGGSSSTNWFNAYPSGNKIDIYNNPYSVFQFGTDPDSLDYELVYYFGKTTEDYTESGKGASYSGGSFDNCIRGWGGTIPKNHIVTGIHVYTPLIITSGVWNEYTGWGLIDLGAACDIAQDALSILPPKNFVTTETATGILFTFAPFRSSNWSGAKVIKNTDRPPKDYTDGLTIFETRDSSSAYITGFDAHLTSGTAYYAAFQYSNRRGGRDYSLAVPYAQDVVTTPSTWTIVTMKADSFIGIEVPPRHENDYMSISSYRAYYTTGDTFDDAPFINSVIPGFRIGNYSLSEFASLTFETGNTVTLETGVDYNVLVYSIPNSFNLVKNSDFKDFSYTGWDYWTITGNSLEDGSYSIVPDMEYNYGRFSVGVTSSGSNAYNRGLRYNELIPITDSSYVTMSAYIKTTGNLVYGMLGIDCYDSGENYLDSVTRTIYTSSTDWERTSGLFLPFASGGSYNLESGTAYIRPVVWGVVSPSESYRMWMANVQVESGSEIHQYSKYLHNTPVDQTTFSVDSLGPPENPSVNFVRRYARYAAFDVSHGAESDRRGTLVKVGNATLGMVLNSGGIVYMPYTTTGTISLQSIDNFNNKSTSIIVSSQDIMYPQKLNFGTDYLGDFNDAYMDPVNIPDFTTITSTYWTNGDRYDKGIWLSVPNAYDSETSPLPKEFLVLEIWRDNNAKNKFVNVYIKDKNTGQIRSAKVTSLNRIIIKRRVNEHPLIHAVSAFEYENPDYSNVLDISAVGE